MKRNEKKRKSLYIAAAAVFLLMALLILVLLMDRAKPPKETEAPPTASPTPEIVVTASPAPEGITIAGKLTDPETDSFDLSGKTLSADDMEAIAGLKKLNTLSLTNCGVDDLRFLSGLDGLRTLYLPDNKITDLNPLGSLTGLRTLYLDRNPIIDLSPLTALPDLSTLSLQGIAVADYVLEDLQQSMPNCRVFCDSAVEQARPLTLGGAAFTEDVEVLDLSNRGITDISRLAYCLQLRDLNLEGNAVQALNTLSGLPRLTALNLADTGLTDGDLDFLKTLQRLSYLNIERNSALTPEALTAFDQAMPHCQVIHDSVLYTVQLGGATFTSDAAELDLSGWGLGSVEGLEHFLQLRRLVLTGNALADLSPLQGLTALEELALGSNQIRDLSPLEGHRALRRLDLSRNAVYDIAPLNGMVWLEELDLSYNQISDVTTLNTCVRLQRLDLTGNPLTADAVRRLQEALPGCRIVTDADLSMPEPTPAPPDGAEVPAAPVTPAPTETPVPAIPEYPDPIPVGESEG